MAYLEHLKTTYLKNRNNRLTDDLEEECKHIIRDCLDVNIAEIKKHIESEFEAEMMDMDPYSQGKSMMIELSNVMIKRMSNDITEYFVKPEYEVLFHKNLKNLDRRYDTEMFILNLAPFQKLKEDIEKELDGLEFDLGLEIVIKKTEHNIYKISSIKMNPYVSFELEYSDYFEDSE